MIEKIGKEYADKRSSEEQSDKNSNKDNAPFNILSVKSRILTLFLTADPESHI